jgi:hypothetical protein
VGLPQRERHRYAARPVLRIVRIPLRVHCDQPLPGNAPWLITEHGNHLIVFLAPDVPEDSPLEQHFVRQAVRTWRHMHPGGLLLIPPTLVAGADVLARLIRQIRRPAIATGTAVAVAGVALAAVTLMDQPQPAPHRSTTAAPPPARPANPTPGDAAPRKPKPAPEHSKAPRPRKPVAAADASTSSVRVDPSRLPVHLPVSVPRVRVTPPPVLRSPVTAGSVPGSRCHLVKVHVGKLVRICL